jgi:hypothetical protein
MKTTRIFAVTALAAAGILAAGTASAHGRGHSHFSLGFNFGVPVYAPYYYYPAPVYYSSPVVVQQAPTVYVERPDAMAPAQPAQPSQNYWYYCNDSRTYYPYVKECPGGWQRVNPTPQ